MTHEENIIATATPAGVGAIALIRLSGKEVVPMVSRQFRSHTGIKLEAAAGYTIHLGELLDGERVLDQVLVSVFKGPHSYTGEDVAEISCHGSPYIQGEILQLFLRKGCRMATAGEFTMRAFLNGKLDLSQAEAVADLIASENAASHRLAVEQMRGGFSNAISQLREELMNFASLIELELDFAEEDVEFADRTQFTNLLLKIGGALKVLVDSFAVGNVLKNGIPVAIAGAPNVGKSTLLNALLREERALVSEIAGTTRDSIEDEISIGGIGFRFIDTAGIRQTLDVVESMGIQRTYEKMKQARVLVYLLDARSLLENLESQGGKHPHPDGNTYPAIVSGIKELTDSYPEKPLLVLANKIDLLQEAELPEIRQRMQDLKETGEQLHPHFISAKTGAGLDTLQASLLELVHSEALDNGNPIVSNARHYQALSGALSAVKKVQEGMESGLSGDLLAIDIRQALFHLGEITGAISSEELLGNIFANFCIGK